MDFDVVFAEQLGASKQYYEPTEEERRRKCEPWILYDEEDGGCLKCAECPATYRHLKQSVSLNKILNHIEAKHIRIKAYPCQFCDQTFYSKHQRVDHISGKHRTENKMAKQAAKYI